MKSLLSFSMVAGDIHWYPHVCTARTLLSTWLSLLFVWDNLLLNLDFPPPPWSWKWASPSQRKISTPVTVLFFDISLISHKCATSLAREYTTMLSICMYYSLHNSLHLKDNLAPFNSCNDKSMCRCLGAKQFSAPLGWCQGRCQTLDSLVMVCIVL